jgi:hypothetical protein
MEDFKNKFKKGDIICSDKFHNGLCMIVDYFKECNHFGPGYSCEDLVQPYQRWSAYLNDLFFNRGVDYNWRIATDDDIAKYLDRYLEINLGKVGDHTAMYEADGIMLELDYGESVFLSVDALKSLRNIIDRVVE